MKSNLISRKLWVTLIVLLAVAGCAPQEKIKVLQPAEIDTEKIKTVAIGRFEVGLIRQRVSDERTGKWQSKNLKLNKRQKEAIARQVRAQVVNALGATPYFKLVYTDEFEKLANDAELQKLVSASGYQSDNIDAVVNGKIWIDMQKINGAEVAKSEMQFVLGGQNNSLNVSVEKMIWWPYKSMRGNLTLELKMTRINPTEVVAVTVDTRSFSHRIGGKPEDFLTQIKSSAATLSEMVADQQKQNRTQIENSAMVFPSFNQLITDLSSSIALNFVRKVAVTEEVVSYPIAKGGDQQGQLLIEVGAYELAIERLQQVTRQSGNSDDLYNLALSFEAIGEYGPAGVFYREALSVQPENLTYARGLGRIEQILREKPAIKRALN